MSISDEIAQIAKNLLARIRKLEIQQAPLPAVYEAVGLPLGSVSLTTTVTAVPGTELVLDPGAYVVEATFYFNPSGLLGANDNTFNGEGSLKLNGVKLSQVALATLDQINNIDGTQSQPKFTVTQTWLVTLWDYREYVITNGAVYIERFHESNTLLDQPATIGGGFSGGPIPFQPPAIGKTDLGGQPTYSMYFDGVDDSIDNWGGAGPFYTAVGSLEIWFKTTAAAVGHLIGNANPIPPTGIGKGAGMYINAAGNIVAGLATAAGVQAVVTSPLAYNDGQWHHAVMAWNASNLNLYIDGVQVAIGASLTPTSGGAPALASIGGRATYYFNGYLDEAAVYLTKLPALAIKNNYNAGTGVIYYPSTLYIDEIEADTPVLLWRLSDLTSVAADSSGNNRPGTYTGVGAYVQAQEGAIIVERDGTYDDAVRLDGLAGYVTRADEAALHIGQGSLEIWFNTTNLAIQYLIGNGDLSALRYGLILSLSATGQVVATVANATTSGSISTTATYADGKWHHVIFTYNGITMRIYVDGDQVASGNPPGAPVVAWNGYAFNVGRAPNGTAYYFNGLLDEAAAYSSVLSAARAETHYLTGKSNRGWLTLCARKTGGAGSSQIASCRMVATKLLAASRS